MVIGAGVGTVVCLEVPVGSEFGVDYEAFRTAEKFRGVKLIPSGLHFVFYASNGEHDNGNGIRQGFFVEIKPNDVVIRTWSSDTEELVPMTREADVENLTRAVHGFQLDGNLGAYPQKHAKTWRRLSKYITKEVLAQCGLTVGGTISPGDPDTLSLESNDLTTLKPFFPDVAQVARFTPLKKPSTTQRSAGDLTLYHVDSSEHLEWLLSTHFHNDWHALLGELQLSFVLFLLLSSLDALHQWKQVHTMRSWHDECCCITITISSLSGSCARVNMPSRRNRHCSPRSCSSCTSTSSKSGQISSKTRSHMTISSKLRWRRSLRSCTTTPWMPSCCNVLRNSSNSSSNASSCNLT
ncbi:hypothetical protein, variant [Aphanomyces astaci]|uniref:AAR2 splicing factor homolog n=1 Tax=Aphanomyces astaci TaxID=112090 RepID=W4HE47_APHAT|nr:hypothetical protein, variant [Aphanomyces astaci]ETV89433.1 hypothetical protein, variant [Aphanomyces astaci]|eukprot:XP_009821833.1 hypothetical protein, variant [Aphanomyces astaci]